MPHKVIFILISVLITFASTTAQLQNVGDVSFSVPDGWTYQQGPDDSGMVMKTDTRFWVLAIYTPMSSSGNANADFRAA